MRPLFNKFLFFNCSLLLISSCSVKEFPAGKFQSTPIVADGNAIDWGLPLRFGNETGALQYAITNDKENLYISIASNDQNTQMKILRSGLKIYIDPKGKKGTDMYIAYPYQDEMDIHMGQRRIQNNDPNVMKKKMIMDADQFSTNGFINMENRIYDATDTSHIKVGMNFDSFNNLVLEAIIPLQYILDKPQFDKKAPNMSIGILVNNMGTQRPGGNGMRIGTEGMRGDGMNGGGMRGGGMNGGGMRGGGMRGGGMRGGGMNGGNYNNSMGNYNNAGKTTPIWYEFKLANQAN
jgi:hypothetical protein